MISLTIDRDALIANIYAGDGKYDGPVSNGLPAFAFSPAELRGYQKFDPKKARELWAAAGSPFPVLRATTSLNIPPFATMTDFIAKQLEANLPVRVKIETVDVATFVSRAVETPANQWELFVAADAQAAQSPDYNSIAMYMAKGSAGVSWSFKEDSPNPDTAKLAKEMQRLGDLAAAAVKPEERKARLDDLQKFRLTSFGPWLSLPVSATAYSVVRKTLRNYPHQDTPSLFQLRAQDIWIAKT